MESGDMIYILEAKIQKQRIKDMREAAKKRKIQTKDKFSSDVTHLVTEFKDIKALETVLKKLGINIEELDHLNIVSVEWFTDCMKAGEVVPVLEKHRIQSGSPEPSVTPEVPNPNVYHMADYACQRATPLNHYNKTLTDALEVLELHAELRDNDADYSRALAFRRASCVLKCLPFRLTSVQQLRKVTNIGDHSRRVIQECLEDGSCTEVEDIRDDPWFQKMKLFSSIYGIGSATAKKLIEKGWSSIREAQEGYSSGDTRVLWGLAFHDELDTPVCKKEAEFILLEVTKHVNRILPGAILALTGGFRRGKPTGHDVDILITHPQIGKEIGLLPRLLHSLQSHDIVLCGRYEKSTYTDAVLQQDFKLSMKGQLDHFEKWLGIFKVPTSIGEASPGIRTETTDTVIYSRQANANAVTSNAIPNKKETVVTNSENGLHNTGLENFNSKFSDPVWCTPFKAEQGETINGKGESPKDSSCSDNVYRDTGSVEDSFQKQDKLDRADIVKLSKEPRGWIARRVDLIISPYDQFFYALVGWTGNKMFNRDLRWYAPREVGMKLTSHGLYDLTKCRKVAAASEQEVFEHLQIPYRDPSDRNC